MLSCGSQPTADRLKELAETGTEAVVNLSLTGTEYELPNEELIVAKHGMQYHHLPVDFKLPQPSQLNEFSALLQAFKTKKVFVHCAANKRASVFIALHGQRYWRWSQSQADEFIHQIWAPSPIWQNLIIRIRQAL